MTFLKVPRFCLGKPKDERLKSNPVLSNRRITIFSPYTVGKIETRTSKSFPGDLIEKRPSCGRRFSAIFKLDRIFILVTKPLKEAIGGVMIV